VGGREHAGPGVEELHRVGAGARLRERVRGERLGELLEQARPDARLAVHERLRDREVARRPPLDEVAGDGERPAAEADDRLVGAELAADGGDRVEHRRDRAGELERPEPVDRRAGADRLRHDRADALDELDLDAEREHRGHDVGEDHGGVDAVAAHRLQRDLGGQLRRAVDLEEPVALPQRAVLRKRPARLPHEPDRRALDGLAPRGAHEQRFHAPYTSAAMAKGPLAVRWLDSALEQPRAGAAGGARVELENAGTIAWGPTVFLSYHWLDERGNPLVWDGIRTPAPPLAPGERAAVEARVRAPIPPGRYRLAFDLVSEHRAWFAELGGEPLDRPVEVLPREGRARAPLPRWVEPGADWRERVDAAHAEGYAVVAGAVDWDGGLAHPRPRSLDPYRPGPG